MSWASPGQASRPRVRIGQRVIPAAERSWADALTGAVTWTYHARVDALRPGATYGYAVGADPVNQAPGEPGAPPGDYTLFETFTLIRPRSDGRRWHPKG